MDTDDSFDLLKKDDNIISDKAIRNIESLKKYSNLQLHDDYSGSETQSLGQRQYSKRDISNLIDRFTSLEEYSEDEPNVKNFDDNTFFRISDEKSFSEPREKFSIIPKKNTELMVHEDYTSSKMQNHSIKFFYITDIHLNQIINKKFPRGAKKSQIKK